jgi:hypothetical protein
MKMKDSSPALSYAERERLLSSDARTLLDATWASIARRRMPEMPEAEAIAGLKELHAAGLVELIRDGDGLALRMTSDDAG